MSWHPARHVEVHWIAAQQATLAELLEFHALDLQLLEALPEDDVAAVHVVGVGGDLAIQRLHLRPAFCRIVECVASIVAFGHDPDAAGQQADGGAGFGGFRNAGSVGCRPPCGMRSRLRVLGRGPIFEATL